MNLIFLRVVEIGIITLVALVIITQLLLPALRGQRLFPFFRKQHELEVDLADAKQAKTEMQIRKMVRKVRKETTKQTRH